MEAKRELTSIDIAALVGELRDYRGAKIDKAYLYPDDLVRFRMRDFDRGRIELLCQVGEYKRIHMADPERVPDAPDRPPNFAKMLRNRLTGASLESVEQYEFDRIVTLRFVRGDESTTVIVELFGQGNLIVCDATDTIIDALETVRLRSRTIAPGGTYEYPDRQLDPFSVGYDRVAGLIQASDADLVRTLATQLNLGGTYAEELCARAGVDGSMPTDNIDEAVIERVYEALCSVADRIRERTFDPRIYRTDDQPVDVTPLPLVEYEALAFEQFDRFSTAVDQYYVELETIPVEEDTDDGPDLAEEIARIERIIDQQRAAIDDLAEEAEATRTRAEMLYAQYDLVDEIISTVAAARADDVPWDTIIERFEDAAEAGNERAAAVTDIQPGDATVTIDLGDDRVTVDVTTGVERNANRLYQEAKAIENKREGAKTALAETEAEREALENRRDSPQPEPVEVDEDEPTDWLSRRSIPVREPDDWFERFRWFRTSDGFLVLGGRNAEQNEELVAKYLERGDRFVHAQAHGGPVTILKGSDPSEPVREGPFPERSLQEAAQFAVAYSSVWKAGQFAGDAYVVEANQVGKDPESGEYLQKGAFVIRGERDYFENIEVEIAIGITCEPVTRVIGGPPDPVLERAEVTCRVQPGEFAQDDVAKRIYRSFRTSFTDTTFVRKIASPDQIQGFLPPGRSRIIEP